MINEYRAEAGVSGHAVDKVGVADDQAEPSRALPGSEHGEWFVLRTRARQEKILAADLAANRIACFLPLRRVERSYCNQRFSVELPMFPGYMFLRGTRDDAYWADRTRRVAQIIDVPDQARLDRELSFLAQAMAHIELFDPYPCLKRGVRVELQSGPLRGLQGLIEDRRRRHRLILQIEALGQAVSLEVDAAIVEVVE
jgi:transcription antitermination factor NusG